MAAEQRRLLEQLMGADALAGKGKAPMLQFTEPKVCRSFLCGLCPHDLFVNTKQDLGPCPKLHSEALRSDYQRERQHRDYGFEFDYERDLARFVDDCQKRIDAAYRRLDKTPEEVRQTTLLLKEMSELERSVAAALDEVEVLGEMGLVDRALDQYYAIVQIKKAEHAQKEANLKALSDNSASTQQKLQVCDVCGAYLSKLDNDRRLADHFGGRMHLGYAKLRDELRRLRAELRHRQRPDKELYKERSRRGRR